MIRGCLEESDFFSKYQMCLPLDPWLNLNTNGPGFNHFGGACGGTLRDCKGNFRGGFSTDLGLCTITEAELWGVNYDLRLAPN